MSDAALASLLVELGVAIRERLRAQRLPMSEASRVVEAGSVDTIFALDRHVEELVVQEIEHWPRELLPVAVFAEGLPNAPTWIGGAPSDAPKYWLLIDPVDGTRGLMYEKRSAYFLAAAAPGHCSSPSLSQCVVSVGVELPTHKAGWADILFWSKGERVSVLRESLLGGEPFPIHVQPSSAVDLGNAFGSVVSFFPSGKQQAARLAEAISARSGATSSAPIFDDQYISTGGQMVELLTGRDRFVVDVRPFLSVEGPCCHPYDLALAPLAAAAGVMLCSTDGPLDASFDLESDVAWCGYANESIQRLVQPVVADFVSSLIRR